MKIVVTGAGGFIAHHLVKRLKDEGHWVRAVDVKQPEYEASPADEFVMADLRHFESCLQATEGMDDVYQLAADMGGIGYITANHASLTRNNTLMNNHMLEAARVSKVDRYLYTSSACVYPSFLQDDEDVTPLREEDAVPADPEKGYGWEKLFAEQLATYYNEECGLDVRIVRFHNIYGPLGTYDGGKEKAPAAICRKVAMAEDGGIIEVWGDGEQTRSFCYVDDCIEGLRRIMESGYTKPINLGTDELVTVNELVDAVWRSVGETPGKTPRPDEAAGCAGPQQRQHLAEGGLGLAARDDDPGGDQAYVRVDSRADNETEGVTTWTGGVLGYGRVTSSLAR